jgi:UDP-N-acetylmuramoyl-tripeptide--D-alanyl-D-alanine ligase
MSNSLLAVLQETGFKVSTDTRQPVTGTVFFALKGEAFDGSTFVPQALEQGAVAAVTENSALEGEGVFVVLDVLKVLQEIAAHYRSLFSIPVLAIGGSNGKTTTRELVYTVLATKLRAHSSKENLNNHIGLPLSILAMSREAEIGVFEIGANHTGEHLELLEVLRPTHVLVTNNGLDHLEGFGSPEGVRQANKEIYDWAKVAGAKAFVNKKHVDLIEDSEGIDRSVYPAEDLVLVSAQPLAVAYRDKTYNTEMAGQYNLENIEAAVRIGEAFGISTPNALAAITAYAPHLKRSQILKIGTNTFVIDCYNANPSSMTLSLESFFVSTQKPRGVVLGDMLELGAYAEAEHRKIVDLVSQHVPEHLIFIGHQFKRALENSSLTYHWFPDSKEARVWFEAQEFSSTTFLLKGSRGMRVERLLSV